MVNDVSFSPDGNCVASASYDKTIMVWTLPSRWDNTSNQQVGVAVWPGHFRGLQSVKFSPSGDQLVSSSNDYTVCIWDSDVITTIPMTKETETSEVFFQLQYHVNAVSLFVFSPDNGILASASRDGVICLWDGNNGAFKRSLLRIEDGERLPPHQGKIISLAFSSDSATLVSASYDRTVRIWETSSGKLKRTLEGHDDWVRCAAISPNGQYVASGSDDCTVRLCDISASVDDVTLDHHTDYVCSVAFSDKYLASGGDDKLICIWDLATMWDNVNKNKPKRILNLHKGFVRDLVFKPDGKHLVSSAKDGKIRLWNTQTWECDWVIDGLQETLRLQILPDHPDDLVTQFGTWSLSQLCQRPKPGELTSFPAPLAEKFPPPPSWSPFGLSRDGCWITWKNKNLIFLPQQYHDDDGAPTARIFLGRKVAIGCYKGQVLMFGMKENIDTALECSVQV
ncbi:hypothetical protein Hte_010263 [Hypoxylon texense]